MNTPAVEAVLAPVVARFGLEIDECHIVKAGSRSLLRVTVDGDGPKGRGPLLDQIAEASKAVSAALDESGVMGERPYVLEVSSRGVDRPLMKPAQWRRNLGRLVAVTLRDGSTVTGRITDAGDETARLAVEPGPAGTAAKPSRSGETEDKVVAYADVAKARIQVEMNRPLDPDLDDPAVEAAVGERDAVRLGRRPTGGIARADGVADETKE